MIYTINLTIAKFLNKLSIEYQKLHLIYYYDFHNISINFSKKRNKVISFN